MAEIDVFERSLAGAFLRLADDVPGAVNAAAVAHRVAREHPRRKTGLRWGPIAAPRPAWVLLLLAGLLAALIGGTVLVGSQIRRTVPAILPPVGQVYECPPGSNPDEPGPVNQARPLLAPWASSSFDRRAGKVIARAASQTDTGLQTWTFDVCTNTWTRMHPDREPPGDSRLVYDVASCRGCRRHRGPSYGMDNAAGVPVGRADVLLGQGQSAAYDATADLCDILYAGTRSDEPGACGTRPECRQMPFMVYDPVNERLVVYGGSIWTDSDWAAHWVSPDDVLAFDTRTREWTLLLAASEGQPVP